MELIELIIIIIAALFGNKRRNEDNSGQPRHRVHRLDPGYDTEGARPKVDRYGLDHAVPVVVFEVGSDELLQPARERARQKRLVIEARLAQEAKQAEDATDAADRRADESSAEIAPPLVAARSASTAKGARGAQADQVAEQASDDADADKASQSMVPSIAKRYPYKFLDRAKAKHLEAPPGQPVAKVAATAPHKHATFAGSSTNERVRMASEVAQMLRSPRSLKQALLAKAVLEAPPSLSGPQRW